MVSGLQPTVGSVKAPGTYARVTPAWNPQQFSTVQSVSGVEGQGGGVYAVTKPAPTTVTSSSNVSGDTQQKSNQTVSYTETSQTSYLQPSQSPPTLSSAIVSQTVQPSQSSSTSSNTNVSQTGQRIYYNIPSPSKTNYSSGTDPNYNPFENQGNIFSNLNNLKDSYLNTANVIGENIATVGGTYQPKGFWGIGIKAAQPFLSGFISSTIKSPVEHPVETAISAGVGFLAPGVIEGIEAVVPAAEKVVPFIETGIGLTYAGYSSYRIATTTFNQGSYAGGQTAGNILGSEIIPAGAGYSFQKSLGVTQQVAKLNPRYIPYEQSGVNIVEGVTIPTTVDNLFKLEGTSIDTIHTTSSSSVKYGTVLAPQPDSVSGWRKNVGQFNFYQSIPSDGKPTIYGGYVGMDSGIGQSNVKYSLFPTENKAFIFRDQTISTTPQDIISQGIKSTVNYQTTMPGTYVPAENVFKLSTEGQVTTSVGIKGNPIFQIEKNPTGDLFNKFTYYKGTKINFYESILSPIDTNVNLKANQMIDMSKESYTNTKPIIESPVSTSSSLFNFDSFSNLFSPKQSSSTSRISPSTVSVSWIDYSPISSTPSGSSKKTPISSGSTGKSYSYSPKISSPFSPPPSSPFNPPYSPPYSPPISSPRSSPLSFPYSLPTSSSFGSFSSSKRDGGFSLPSFGLMDFGTSPRKRKSKRRKSNILPSFTAEAFNIFGKAPKSGQYGINPFQFRALTKNKNAYATKF
jgi:hypothetical protein